MELITWSQSYQNPNAYPIHTSLIFFFYITLAAVGIFKTYMYNDFLDNFHIILYNNCKLGVPID